MRRISYYETTRISKRRVCIKMGPMRRVIALYLLIPVFGLICAVPSNLLAAKPGKRFNSTILPILQSKCFSCHGEDVQEAEVRLDTLSIDFVNDRASVQTWQEALNALNKDEMPPEDGDPLTAKERQLLTNWIRGEIDRAVQMLKSTGGRVVMRRLNRTEYQNTMRDLLGLNMDYARDLPPEGLSPDGFRNNGQSLQMTSIQLEYYLAAARRGLDRIIKTGPAPKVFKHKFDKSNVNNWFNVEIANYLGRSQAFYGKMVDDYPEQGNYIVRVKASAKMAQGAGFPILEVSVGYRPDTKDLWEVTSSVEMTTEDSQVFEFTGRVENHPLPVRGQGKFPGLVVRVRNMYDDYTRKPKQQDVERDGKKQKGYPYEEHMPHIQVEEVEFIGPVFDQWPPALHRAILHESELSAQDEAAYMAEVLERFMSRAFRRPATNAEVMRMVGFYQSIRSEFPSLEDAAIETLAMVLISPQFLYLLEPDSSQKRKLNDYEIASRMSYFLWSTMPDQELLDLAADRRLSKPSVLEQQVTRMLEDERSWRFVNQFTDEWLKLDNINQIAINTDVYQGFNEALKTEMVMETRHFFRELLMEDLSALSLLDSNFTMLNENLARHYGVDGVLGREFRRVDLTDEKRGGLLGQASVLMLGSTGQDSHPIRRAVWLRDRILNDPPAPPPPDVPDLDESNPDFAKLTVREQLEVHRQKESCASCHRGIDPWGIAMEHFDAVGNYREMIRIRHNNEVGEREVVASDVLPDGNELDGMESLKDYLLSKKTDDFANSLVSRMTVYALGRNLELTDQELVDDLTKEFAKNGYKMQTLISEIIASSAFRSK